MSTCRGPVGYPEVIVTIEQHLVFVNRQIIRTDHVQDLGRTPAIVRPKAPLAGPVCATKQNLVVKDR